MQNGVPNRRASLSAAPTTREEDIYTTRPRSSVVRYTTDPKVRVIRSGNQQLVIHRGNPPSRPPHWLAVAGMGAAAAIIVIGVVSAILQAWGNWQADQKYGYPRTSQLDAVVGHNDGPDRKTHFVFLNLNAQVLITEIPGGDGAHARMYVGPKLTGENADKIPITAEFSDQTGRGTTDMVLVIRDQRIVFLNDGTKFKQEGE